MPSESESQRRWAYGVKGPDWAEEHHFNNPGKLPEKAKDKEMKDNSKCDVCGSPLATKREEGCVIGFCAKKSEKENDDEKMETRDGYLECRAAIDIPLATSRNELVYLPAGIHSITPVGGGIGKAIKIKIDARAADEMESQRRAIHARSGKRPYFDFNHEDGAASFWPNEFLWRKGEGVVCRGEWSRSGRDAVEGKDFRAFSPVFYVDDKRANPATVICREDAKPNMGGLVNDPAFSDLPLWAKNAGAASASNNNNLTKEKQQMTNEENAALQKRIAELESTVADLHAVVAGDADNELMQAKLVAAEAELRAAKAEAIAAKAEERTAAQAQVLSSRAKADADAAVADAIRRGAIKAKDIQRQQWWKEQCVTDPNNISILKGMPGHDHLFGAITGNSGSVRSFGGSQIVVASEDPRSIIRKLATLQRNQLTSSRIAMKDKAILAKEFGAIYSSEFGQFSKDGLNRIAGLSPRSIDDALYAGDNTDANLGTLSGTLVTQRTLELLKFTFPSLVSFTTDFSDQPAQFGQTIMTRTVSIPTVVDYNTTTGWAASTATTTDVAITINKHRGVEIDFNSNILESTVRRLFDELAPAQAYAVAKDLVDALYVNLTDANFTNNSVVASASFTRNSLVDISNALNKRGVPFMDRTALLYPDAFANLEKDSTIVQPMAFLQMNLIKGGQQNPPKFIMPVAGFEVINAPNIPSNNGNVVGFAGSKSALIIATRVPNDYTTVLPGASYGNVAMVTDPDIGITVLQVQYVNHTLGTANSRLALMYGTAAGQGSAGQLIKANTGSGSSH